VNPSLPGRSSSMQMLQEKVLRLLDVGCFQVAGCDACTPRNCTSSVSRVVRRLLFAAGFPSAEGGAGLTPNHCTSSSSLCVRSISMVALATADFLCFDGAAGGLLQVLVSLLRCVSSPKFVPGRLEERFCYTKMNGCYNDCFPAWCRFHVDLLVMVVSLSSVD
jgi:hypothetical protein